MVPADRAALVDLWVASWREAMPEIDFEARRGWIDASLRDPAHRTLVAEDGGGLVGFVSLEGDYLHQLVVASGCKGSGVATRLLNAAKAAAPRGLTLDVNQGNPRAVRFYAREGFATTTAGTNLASGLATRTMRWRP